MRILYMPLFGNVSLGGCGIFNSTKVLMKALVERYPDVRVYYPYPEGSAFDTSAISFLQGHDRIFTIPVSAMRHQTEGIFYVPSDLIEKFRSTDGLYPCDIMICDLGRVSLWADMMLNDQVRCNQSRIPLVNVHPFAGSKEGRFSSASDAFEFAQMLGATVGPNIWPCKTVFDNIMKRALLYLQPALVSKIRKQSHVGASIPIGCDRIDQHSKPKPKDELRVAYGSRLNPAYDFETIFREIDLMFRGGTDLTLYVTTPSSAAGRVGGKALAQLSHLHTKREIVIGCQQEQYYEVASQCHMAFWAIKEMELSVSLREQVYMKIAVVVPDTAIYAEILPGYPYKYKNMEEARALLRFIAKSYWTDEVQAVVDRYSQMMRDRYHAENIVADLYRIVHGTLVEHEELPENKGTAESCAKMLKSLFDEFGWPDQMTYSEFRAFVKKYTNIGKDIEITFTGVGRVPYIRALKLLGYVDAGGIEPLYVRNQEAV